MLGSYIQQHAILAGFLCALSDRRVMQFSKSVKNEEQTRRFSIAPAEAGWEVREEHNGQVVRRVRCQDWHRVERVKRSMVIELNALREKGWRDDN